MSGRRRYLRVHLVMARLGWERFIIDTALEPIRRVGWLARWAYKRAGYDPMMVRVRESRSFVSDGDAGARSGDGGLQEDIPDDFGAGAGFSGGGL